MSSPRFTLTLSCAQRPGIVHAVATRLFENVCDIVDTNSSMTTSARASRSLWDHSHRSTRRRRRGPGGGPVSSGG